MLLLVSITAWFFGDPHIETLDGTKYTFNGYGEYVMLKISNDSTSFELQSRMSLAHTENGTVVNATVFSAFVGLDNFNASFQVEITEDLIGMIF